MEKKNPREWNGLRPVNLNWSALVDYFSTMETPREAAKTIRKLVGFVAVEALKDGGGFEELAFCVSGAMMLADAIDDLDLGEEASEYNLVPKVKGTAAPRNRQGETPFEIIE